MTSHRPTKAGALPSPYADPTPIVRTDPPADGRVPARPHARAYTRPEADTQVPPAVGRHVSAAALAVKAAQARLARRRDALAAAVAAARASGATDEGIRAQLIVDGLDGAEIDAALA